MSETPTSPCYARYAGSIRGATLALCSIAACKARIGGFRCLLDNSLRISSGVMANAMLPRSSASRRVSVRFASPPDLSSALSHKRAA